MIPFGKRIQYIEAIAERMSGGTVPRRIDHSIIKNKVKFQHKIIEKLKLSLIKSLLL